MQKCIAILVCTLGSRVLYRRPSSGPSKVLRRIILWFDITVIQQHGWWTVLAKIIKTKSGFAVYSLQAFEHWLIGFAMSVQWIPNNSCYSDRHPTSPPSNGGECILAFRPHSQLLWGGEGTSSVTSAVQLWCTKLLWRHHVQNLQTRNSKLQGKSPLNNTAKAKWFWMGLRGWDALGEFSITGNKIIGGGQFIYYAKPSTFASHSGVENGSS